MELSYWNQVAHGSGYDPYIYAPTTGRSLVMPCLPRVRTEDD